MANKKILIIEDEKSLIDTLSKKLKNEGYEVFVAYDGKEGLESIAEKKPDLIMLDMLMPNIDGYGVLEKMREENNKIPIIIISNSGQPVDVDRALKLGAKDYLVKAELDLDEIMEKVKNCIDNNSSSNLDCPPGSKKILIVEDDEFLRQLCAKKMNQMNFCVDMAVDGIKGYEKIIKGKPDLVLLDIIMPGMEGFDVLKKVREDKDEEIANIPIIMLSNLGQESDIEKAMQLKASDYLIKAHFTTDEIVEKVKKYLK